VSKPYYITISRLASSGKKGELKPDSEGYYEVVLGALGVRNSGGAYYPKEGNMEMFSPNSILQRRIRNGHLYMEQGHPKREPGMTDSQWLERVVRTEETRHCGHIKEVRLESNYSPLGENSNNIVAIIGMVKPVGVYKDNLEEYLNTPSINPAFSVRSFTRDKFQSGCLYKYFEDIISWDFVSEPGIAQATKWDSPSMESIYNNISEGVVTLDAINKVLNIAPQQSLSMESLETLNHIKEKYKSTDKKIWGTDW